MELIASYSLGLFDWKMQVPTTRVSVRLKPEHHRMLKNLAEVYGSQQKAVEHALEQTSIGEGIHDSELLDVRRKILSYPRTCLLDRDILDAIISRESSAVSTLLTGVLTIFVAGKILEEASIEEILRAVRELFVASNLFEGVTLDYESETGTHLLAFHYDNSTEYAKILLVEPLRYILNSKGIDATFKLSPKYGYMMIRESSQR